MAVQWEQIVAKIQERLVQDAVIPSREYAQPIARSRWQVIPHLRGDRDILIRLKGLQSPQEIVQGAGRLARMYRTIDIILRSRISRDKYGSESQWLLVERGHTAFELEVIDSLQMFHPENDDEELLTGEPIRFLDSTDPDRDIETAGKIQGWGSSILRFQVMFEPDLAHTERQ